MNVIFGASGFAKEVEWLFYEKNNREIDYYVDREHNGMLNNIPIISEENFFNKVNESTFINVFLGIGNTAIREKIYEKLNRHQYYNFENLIHPSAIYDKRRQNILLGKGIIICANNTLTTNIKIGDFVHLNLDCTVGHDTTIGSFVTISPGSHISGNVQIGNHVFIGTGAVILENVSICDEAIIGAGAVVSKSITESGTYVGIPARKIK